MKHKAKEKANELVGKYEVMSLSGKMPLVLAKIYAEFAVDEIIRVICQFNDNELMYAYWKQVKEEINKL